MKDLLSKEHYCYKTQRSLIKKMTSSVKRQKGECQNGCFKKTKHTKFSEKRAFLTWNTRIKICPSALLLTTYFLYKKSRDPPPPPPTPPHTHPFYDFSKISFSPRNKGRGRVHPMDLVQSSSHIYQIEGFQ